MTTDDYTDPTKWMELPPQGMILGRYKTLEDAQAHTKPIPKFSVQGNIADINPEWNAAEWEEFVVFNSPAPGTKPKSPGESGFDLED
jgi:hypothetical protein